MKTSIVAALPVVGLLSLAGVSVIAAPNDRQDQAQERTQDRPGQITFQTLDNDIQQVTAAQIWRVRAATTRTEPAGAIVVDYGYDRIYVKDSLEGVVEKIRGQRELHQFTLPSGAPIYIAPDKITGVSRPIPHQHHQNTNSVIVAREGEQQVQESRQSVSEVMK